MPIEQMDPCPVHSISCRVHGPGPFIRLVVEDPSSELLDIISYGVAQMWLN